MLVKRAHLGDVYAKRPCRLDDDTGATKPKATSLFPLKLPFSAAKRDEERCYCDVTEVFQDKCSGEAVCSLPLERSDYAKRCGEERQALEILYACIPESQVMTSCHEEIDTSVFGAMQSGDVRSPGHPDFYPGPIECTWQVKARHGQAIRISIQDMKLRHYGANTSLSECKDFLLVAESDERGRRRVLSKSCARPLAAEATLLTQAHRAHIVLNTASMWTSRGVWFHYEVVGCPTPVLRRGVRLVERNQSTAVFACPLGAVFRDAWEPFERSTLRCIDYGSADARWQKTLANCTRDMGWRDEAVASLRSGPIARTIVILVVLTILLACACAVAILIVLRRRSEREEDACGDAEGRKLNGTAV